MPRKKGSNKGKGKGKKVPAKRKVSPKIKIAAKARERFCPADEPPPPPPPPPPPVKDVKVNTDVLAVKRESIEKARNVEILSHVNKQTEEAINLAYSLKCAVDSLKKQNESLTENLSQKIAECDISLKDARCDKDRFAMAWFEHDRHRVGQEAKLLALEQSIFSERKYEEAVAREKKKFDTALQLIDKDRMDLSETVRSLHQQVDRMRESNKTLRLKYTLIEKELMNSKKRSKECTLPMFYFLRSAFLHAVRVLARDSKLKPSFIGHSDVLLDFITEKMQTEIKLQGSTPLKPQVILEDKIWNILFQNHTQADGMKKFTKKEIQSFYNRIVKDEDDDSFEDAENCRETSKSPTSYFVNVEQEVKKNEPIGTSPVETRIDVANEMEEMETSVNVTGLTEDLCLSFNNQDVESFEDVENSLEISTSHTLEFFSVEEEVKTSITAVEVKRDVENKIEEMVTTVNVTGLTEDLCLSYENKDEDSFEDPENCREISETFTLNFVAVEEEAVETEKSDTRAVETRSDVENIIKEVEPYRNVTSLTEDLSLSSDNEEDSDEDDSDEEDSDEEAVIKEESLLSSEVTKPDTNTKPTMNTAVEVREDEHNLSFSSSESCDDPSDYVNMNAEETDDGLQTWKYPKDEFRKRNIAEGFLPSICKLERIDSTEALGIPNNSKLSPDKSERTAKPALSIHLKPISPDKSERTAKPALSIHLKPISPDKSELTAKPALPIQLKPILRELRSTKNRVSNFVKPSVATKPSIKSLLAKGCSDIVAVNKGKMCQKMLFEKKYETQKNELKKETKGRLVKSKTDVTSIAEDLLLSDDDSECKSKVHTIKETALTGNETIIKKGTRTSRRIKTTEKASIFSEDEEVVAAAVVNPGPKGLPSKPQVFHNIPASTKKLAMSLRKRNMPSSSTTINSKKLKTTGIPKNCHVSPLKPDKPLNSLTVVDNLSTADKDNLKYVSDSEVPGEMRRRPLHDQLELSKKESAVDVPRECMNQVAMGMGPSAVNNPYLGQMNQYYNPYSFQGYNQMFPQFNNGWPNFLPPFGAPFGPGGPGRNLPFNANPMHPNQMMFSPGPFPGYPPPNSNPVSPNQGMFPPRLGQSLQASMPMPMTFLGYPPPPHLAPPRFPVGSANNVPSNGNAVQPSQMMFPSGLGQPPQASMPMTFSGYPHHLPIPAHFSGGTGNNLPPGPDANAVQSQIMVPSVPGQPSMPMPFSGHPQHMPNAVQPSQIMFPSGSSEPPQSSMPMTFSGYPQQVATPISFPEGTDTNLVSYSNAGQPSPMTSPSGSVELNISTSLPMTFSDYSQPASPTSQTEEEDFQAPFPDAWGSVNESMLQEAIVFLKKLVEFSEGKLTTNFDECLETLPHEMLDVPVRSLAIQILNDLRTNLMKPPCKEKSGTGSSPLTNRMRKLLVIIEMLSKSPNFKELPRLTHEYFLQAVVPNRWINFAYDRIVLEPLGRFYGTLLDKFQLDGIQNLFFEALYWRPPHAFALTYGVLKVNSTQYSYFKFPEYSLKDRAILFALMRGPRFQDCYMLKQLRGFLSTCLRLEVPDLTFEQFVEQTVLEIKDLESDTSLREGYKILAMLFIQGGLEWTLKFLEKQLPEVTKEWMTCKVSDGVYACLIKAVGYVCKDSVEHANLTQLRSMLENLKKSPQIKDFVLEGISDCVDNISAKIDSMRNRKQPWVWKYFTIRKQEGNSWPSKKKKKKKTSRGRAKKVKLEVVESV